MATATINERVREAAAAVRDTTAAACRQAAAVSRDALGEGAVDNLVYVADRTARKMRRGLQMVDDYRAGTAHCITRQPFTAVGVTLAVGLAIGVVIGRLRMVRH